MKKKPQLLTGATIGAALVPSLIKLNPRHQSRNPVMFTVFIGSLLATLLVVAEFSLFVLAIAALLWLTVLFANFAEAIAEGRRRSTGTCA